MNVEHSAALAVDVKGSFEFDAADVLDNDSFHEGEKGSKPAPGSEPSHSAEAVEPFSLRDIDITVSKGPHISHASKNDGRLTCQALWYVLLVESEPANQHC